MISPRYGEPCCCEACTVAGVRGQRVIEVAPGVWAHGRDLARLYTQIRKFQTARFGGKPRRMPEATVQTKPNGEPL